MHNCTHDSVNNETHVCSNFISTNVLGVQIDESLNGFFPHRTYSYVGYFGIAKICVYLDICILVCYANPCSFTTYCSVAS